MNRNPSTKPKLHPNIKTTRRKASTSILETSLPKPLKMLDSAVSPYKKV